MGLFHYLWSRTAASNATADANVNWAEGMAPSAVNDSARAMMAAAAGFRDDISGAIVTGGTSTAYTVTSYQVFNSLANMNGQVIAFTPHTSNGATVTLNVDGLGAKPLRTSTDTALLEGTLIAGTPYSATYNSSDAVWYLHSFYGNPYNVPLGAGMDYWLPTAPNSSFVFPIGQAISRTTYAPLFALMSTTYGAGNGTTTFNLPDKRGRSSVAADASAGRISGAAFNTVIAGGVGGTETKTLVTANLPAYTPTGSITNGTTSSSDVVKSGAALTGAQPGAGAIALQSGFGSVGNATVTASFVGTAQGGTSTAFSIVQPSIICNYILRVL
jgi:microcystin-dependent protein